MLLEMLITQKVSYNFHKFHDKLKIQPINTRLSKFEIDRISNSRETKFLKFGNLLHKNAKGALQRPDLIDRLRVNSN